MPRALLLSRIRMASEKKSGKKRTEVLRVGPAGRHPDDADDSNGGCPLLPEGDPYQPRGERLGEEICILFDRGSSPGVLAEGREDARVDAEIDGRRHRSSGE